MFSAAILEVNSKLSHSIPDHYYFVLMISSIIMILIHVGYKGQRALIVNQTVASMLGWRGASKAATEEREGGGTVPQNRGPGGHFRF